MNITLSADNSIALTRGEKITRGQNRSKLILVRWEQGVSPAELLSSNPNHIDLDSLVVQVNITRADGEYSGWQDMIKLDGEIAYYYSLTRWDTEVEGKTQCQIRWFKAGEDGDDDNTTVYSSNTASFIVDKGVIAQNLLPGLEDYTTWQVILTTLQNNSIRKYNVDNIPEGVVYNGNGKKTCPAVYFNFVNGIAENLKKGTLFVSKNEKEENGSTFINQTETLFSNGKILIRTIKFDKTVYESSNNPVENDLIDFADISTNVSEFQTLIQTLTNRITTLETEMSGKQSSLGFTPENVLNKSSTIDDSESKYPTNKAVQDFVNSSIATNTAHYISNSGSPFLSVEALNNYEGNITNNDYAFVVDEDEDGNILYTRYKYNANTEEWAKEYVLNNSSFTATQWAAISSGITSALVNSFVTHLTNTNNPHGVTKAQVGLNNVDNTSDLSKPISNLVDIELNKLKTIIGSVSPTSSTEGVIGQLYFNSSTGIFYRLKEVKEVLGVTLYTWEDLEKPIVDAVLPLLNPVANTYYRHKGSLGQFIPNVLYYYNGSSYKSLTGGNSGSGNSGVTIIITLNSEVVDGLIVPKLILADLNEIFSVAADQETSIEIGTFEGCLYSVNVTNLADVQVVQIMIEGAVVSYTLNEDMDDVVISVKRPLKENGYYQNMTVGLADDLANKGNAALESFVGLRTAGGVKDINTGLAQIKSIKGKTLSVNQKIQNGNLLTAPALVAQYGSSYEYDNVNHKVIYTPSSSNFSNLVAPTNFDTVLGHTYLFRVKLKLNKQTDTNLNIEIYDGQEQKGAVLKSSTQIQTASVVKTASTNFFNLQLIRNEAAITDEDFFIEIYSYELIDLTQWFGAGNEPTAEEFNSKYPDYIEKGETLINSKLTGLKIVGFNQLPTDLSNELEVSLNTRYRLISDTAKVTKFKNWLKRLKKLSEGTNFFYRVTVNTEGTLVADTGQLSFLNSNSVALLYCRRNEIFNLSNLSLEDIDNIVFVAQYGIENTTVTLSNICINISHSGYRNGEYEEYKEETLTIPVETYFPDGMASVGDVADELLPDKAIQRIDQTETPYTVLDTPIETPITNPLNFNYEVDDFGTEEALTFGNDEIKAPINFYILYGLNASDAVKNLPKNYVSKESIQDFITALGTSLGKTITMTWSEENRKYTFTITENS